jgi:hypothetical protein
MTPQPRSISQDNQAILQIQNLDEKGAYIRMAACKALENCLCSTPGTGYAIYQAGDEGLAFALLEGISSTFHSELAAEYLGKRLIEWLWELPASKSDDVKSLTAHLGELLGHWTPESQELLKAYEFDEDVPKMVRESLVDIREMFGSEVVFGCGRVWKTVEGNRTGVFFWTNDIQINAWDSEGKRLPLPTARYGKNCWSSKFGLKGQLTYWAAPPGVSVSYIGAYSSGFPHEIPEAGTPDRELTRRMLQGLLEEAKGDQVLFEAAFLNGPLTTERTGNIPIIKEARTGIEGEYHLTWKAENGQVYELEIAEDFSFLNRVKIEPGKKSFYAGKLMSPGRFYARLRQITPEGDSQWSRTVCLVYPGKPPASTLPSIYMGENGKNGFDIRWDPVDEAVFYILETVERNRSEQPELKISAVTSGTIFSARGNSPSILRLRAVNEDGESTAIRLETGAGGSPIYSQEKPPPIMWIEPDTEKVIEKKKKKRSSKKAAKAALDPEKDGNEAEKPESIHEKTIHSKGDTNPEMRSETKTTNSESFNEETASIEAGAQAQPVLAEEPVPELHQTGIESETKVARDTPNQTDDLFEDEGLQPPSFIQIKEEKKLFIKEVKLWWSEVQGREDFEIWISQQPIYNDNPGHHYMDVRNNSYTTRVTNFAPGVYYFRVRARAKGKAGQWSKQVEARLNIDSLNVQVQKGNLPASIRVSWKAIEGVLAYEVSEIAYNQPPQRPNRIEGTSFFYEKRSPGHYQYQVRAVFEGGKGEWEKPKDQKAIIVPEPLHSAPRSLKAHFSANTKITLSWIPVEGALIDGYRIEADSGKGRFELINPSKYRIKEMPHQVIVELVKMPIANYSFRVCAYNFSGAGPWSGVEKVVLQGEVPTHAPEEALLPIDKETILLERGGVYDWGYTANSIADLVHEKKLRVSRYVLQERLPGNQYKTRGEYNELLRPYLEVNREYRYALFDLQGKLLAVVSFMLDRTK